MRWIAAAVLIVVTACSGDDAADRASKAVSEPEASDPVGSAPGPSVSATTASTAAPMDPPAGSAGPTASSAPAPEPVPDVGVPGLDDEEVLCRSWSRIAGSFQVVAVASAFGTGDPLEATRLEVIGSPVVVEALAALVDAWPVELAAEADLVAEQFLGPFVRRAERARLALLATGADEDDLDRLADSWLDALAGRDPAAPVLTVELAADLEEAVSAATADFGAAVPSVPQDPTLVTEVRVPATEAYVVDRCPDRGTLGGTEISG